VVVEDMVLPVRHFAKPPGVIGNSPYCGASSWQRFEETYIHFETKL